METQFRNENGTPRSRNFTQKNEKKRERKSKDDRKETETETETETEPEPEPENGENRALTDSKQTAQRKRYHPPLN